MPVPDRLKLLLEAKALEDLGADWSIQHAAAVCGCSASLLYRADIPRVERRGERGVKGKPMLSFRPSVVRAWNESRIMNHPTEKAS
jgi:hypothetical protein